MKINLTKFQTKQFEQTTNNLPRVSFLAAWWYGFQVQPDHCDAMITTMIRITTLNLRSCSLVKMFEFVFQENHQIVFQDFWLVREGSEHFRKKEARQERKNSWKNNIWSQPKFFKKFQISYKLFHNSPQKKRGPVGFHRKLRSINLLDSIKVHM